MLRTIPRKRLRLQKGQTGSSSTWPMRPGPARAGGVRMSPWALLLVTITFCEDPAPTAPRQGSTQLEIDTPHSQSSVSGRVLMTMSGSPQRRLPVDKNDRSVHNALQPL
mmetsp:Transcript_51720/g.113411  ORF Transcript_51720/g.113411 Transcript_51720/m.113411 type:complete len:109 (-) Transcript_51720:1308-1634(-)